MFAKSPQSLGQRADGDAPGVPAVGITSPRARCRVGCCGITGASARWRRSWHWGCSHEGSNDIAWGLIGFDDLAAYERYRNALKVDAEGCANFERAQAERFILREERSWLQDVRGTRNLARHVSP